MKAASLALTVAMMFLLCACDHESTQERRAALPEAQFVTEYLNRYVQQDSDYLLQHSVEALHAQLSPQAVRQLRDSLPGGKLLTLRRMRTEVRASNQTARAGRFAYELQFADGWAVADIGFQRQQRNMRVTDIQVRSTTAAQSELNRFSLQGKTFEQHLGLLAAILVPVFILFTLTACLRSTDQQHRVPWVMMILIGFGQLNVNWTTGSWLIEPWSVHFLGLGISIGGADGPWLLGAALPVGAILFWTTRFSRKAVGTATPVGDPAA